MQRTLLGDAVACRFRFTFSPASYLLFVSKLNRNNLIGGDIANCFVLTRMGQQRAPFVSMLGILLQKPDTPVGFVPVRTAIEVL
jgi:hypothetical protein